MKLYFIGENLGDEDFLFETLAPFIESGRHIDMAGEDESVWRWLFTFGVVRKQQGSIQFADDQTFHDARSADF